jgi:hypothetical protein
LESLFNTALKMPELIQKDSDFAIWVEEDYCSPPLAMEREAVLDRDFNDITVEKVESENEAWSRLKNKPQLWSKQ